MADIFLTSDTHFGHDRGFVYEPRGFGSIAEHDEAIIQRWNEIVPRDAIVYHAGDVMLNNNDHGIECLSRLNGNIKILPGNHDTKTRLKLYAELPNVEVLGLAEMFKYGKYTFYMSHFPTLTGNFDNGVHLSQYIINLFGHTHQNYNFHENRPWMYHVGVDSHNCAPVHIDDALVDMKNEVEVCLSML